MIEINLFGVIHGIHFAYPVMIRQGFGHIINLSSGYGMAPGPLNSPYVASKFGIFGVSHALALEARKFGVDVSVVCPGFIKTELIDGLKPVNADARDFVGLIPVKMVPVARAAQIILGGVARKKMLIAFPRYVSILAFLHRFLPGVFRAAMLKDVEKFRAIRRMPS